MLIQFKVSNYRSIAEEQVLSLVPSGTDTEHVLANGPYTAMNACAVYGPNSSGKSNLFKAIHTMDKMIFLSNKMNSTTSLPYDPNLLMAGYSKLPTEMELTFVIKEIRYRYGLSYNKERILTEYLFRKRTGREVELFYREGEDIDVSSGLGTKALRIDAAIESTRANALFLSSCDQFNLEEATTVFDWLKKLISIDGLDTATEEVNTLELLEQDAYAEAINAYLRRLDLGFQNIAVEAKEFDVNDLSDIPDGPQKTSMIQRLTGSTGRRIMASHQRYDVEGKPVGELQAWPVDDKESSGTLKAIHLSGPIIYALRNGGTLLIDEVEAKMHTKMTNSILSLFLNPEVNTRGSQVLFTTHDTNLLNSLNLRRDQIYFIEKGKSENSQLYSLSDIVYADGKKERKESDREKRYLEDRYGATPNIDFSQFQPA